MLRHTVYVFHCLSHYFPLDVVALAVASFQFFRKAPCLFVIFAQQQLSQYGIYNAPDDLIRQQAERYMQDDRAREMIQEHAIDNKFFAAVKESVKVNEKTISVDDFRKLYEQDEKK